jgi:PAS domain-containing protein
VDFITKPFHQEGVVAGDLSQLLLKKFLIDKNLLSTKILEKERLYRTIVNKVPELIFQLDESYKIIFACPAFRQLGNDPDELVGKPIESILDPIDEESLDKVAIN